MRLLTSLERNCHIELTLQVEFSIEPEDPSVGIYGDAISIEGVYIGRTEITAELTKEQMAEIEEQLWDRLQCEAESSVISRWEYAHDQMVDALTAEPEPMQSYSEAKMR